jgi:hypothetical protein
MLMIRPALPKLQPFNSGLHGIFFTFLFYSMGLINDKTTIGFPLQTPCLLLLLSPLLLFSSHLFPQRGVENNKPGLVHSCLSVSGKKRCNRRKNRSKGGNTILHIFFEMITAFTKLPQNPPKTLFLFTSLFPDNHFFFPLTSIRIEKVFGTYDAFFLWKDTQLSGSFLNPFFTFPILSVLFTRFFTLPMKKREGEGGESKILFLSQRLDYEKTGSSTQY